MTRIRLLVLLLVVIAIGAACADGEAAPESTSSSVPPSTSTTMVEGSTSTTAPPESTSSTDTATTTTTSTTTTSVAPSTTERPGPKVVLIAVEIVGGEVVVGEDEYEVERDSIVELVVTADVAEEVHVHGYDEFVDLVPGETGSVTFTASIPGIFEVELEGSGLLLFELVVS